MPKNDLLLRRSTHLYAVSIRNIQCKHNYVWYCMKQLTVHCPLYQNASYSGVCTSTMCSAEFETWSTILLRMKAWQEPSLQMASSRDWPLHSTKTVGMLCTEEWISHIFIITSSCRSEILISRCHFLYHSYHAKSPGLVSWSINIKRLIFSISTRSKVIYMSPAH